MQNKNKFTLGKGGVGTLLVASMFFFAAANGSSAIAGEPKTIMADDAPPEAAEKAPFDIKDPKRIESGKKQFNVTCAAWCHGKDPVLFVDREGLDEQYVYKTIRDGGAGAKSPMPSWGSTFSSEEIWELVSYIKSLGKW